MHAWQRNSGVLNSSSYREINASTPSKYLISQKGLHSLQNLSRSVVIN